MSEPEPRVEYSEHLKFKLQVRQIPQKLPERVYRQAKQRYFDRDTGRHVAILAATHRRRQFMMIAYDKFDDYVEIVTIHPIEKHQIRNRINSGRWINE